MNAPKSSFRITLLAPIDDVGGALPLIAITQPDDKRSIFAPSHVQLGTNYFSTNKEQCFPGMPKVERDGTTHQGTLYQPLTRAAAERSCAAPVARLPPSSTARGLASLRW
jgi:hypothetical protein